MLAGIYGVVDCGTMSVRDSDHVTRLLDLVGELVVTVTVRGEVGTGGGGVLAVAVRQVGGKLDCRLYVRRQALTGRTFVSHPLHRYLIVM